MATRVMKKVLLLLIVVLLLAPALNATVSSPVNRWSYATNGTQTVFPYLSKIFLASDLTVHLRTAAGVDVLQTLNVDYTVSGVGVAAGGNVTFGAAPADDQTVIIRIVLPFLQDLALPEGGRLPSAPLEASLDRMVKRDQQLQEQLNRTLRLPLGAGASAQLAEPAAGSVIGWDSLGTALTNYPTTPLAAVITDISQYGDSLATAVAEIGAGSKLLLINKAVTLSANLAVPENIQLWITREGRITVADAALTINGTLDAGLYQIFSCTGTGAVAFGNGVVVRGYPQWWGVTLDSAAAAAANTTAINAALTALAGKEIYFTDGTYYFDGVLYPLAGTTITGQSWDAILSLKNSVSSSRAINTNGNDYITIRNLKMVGNNDTDTAVAHQGIAFLDGSNYCLAERIYFEKFGQYAFVCGDTIGTTGVDGYGGGNGHIVRDCIADMTYAVDPAVVTSSAGFISFPKGAAGHYADPGIRFENCHVIAGGANCLSGFKVNNQKGGYAVGCSVKNLTRTVNSPAAFSVVTSDGFKIIDPMVDTVYMGVSTTSSTDDSNNGNVNKNLTIVRPDFRVIDRYGVFCDDGIDGLKILGGLIHDAGTVTYNIQLQTILTDYTNLIIDGLHSVGNDVNIIDDVATSLIGSQYAKIQNCIFDNCNVLAQQSDYIAIQNNTFKNITGVAITTTGTPSIISGNVGVITTPAVPASTVEERNTSAFPVRVQITGGTVTVIEKGPTSGSLVTTGATAGVFTLQPMEYIAITYSVAPTWQWEQM